MLTFISTFLICLITTFIIVKMLGGKLVLSPNCPECNLKLPAVRHPSSFKQAMLGGWTCEGCGCELDRKGNKIASEENRTLQPKKLDVPQNDIPNFFDNNGKTPVERVFEEKN